MHENIAVADINSAVNGIELSFGKKPPYEVLKDLKENGFRWHNKKQIWYGRNTAAHVRAVAKYVDINASSPSFGVTPEGSVDVREIQKNAVLSDSGREKGLVLENSIKNWYVREFPDDADIMADASEQCTFKDAFDVLNSCGDLYSLSVINDTVVRERIFKKLSLLLECSSDDIYNQWIKGTPGALNRFLNDETSGVKTKRTVVDEAPCIADFYDSVGGADICRDSTIEGSLWSTIGSKGYYRDINAYIWCNSNAAIVIELDNAMRRGKECKRYSIYSDNTDIYCYLCNELKIKSPKDLYDFVRSGEKLPEGATLTVRGEKGVDVFSPFVPGKPLNKLPEKWKKGDLVKAIMSGQVFSGVLDQRLTDDYAYDAAYNFGSGTKLNLPSQAAALVEGCRDCYIRTDGVDENGVASIHFSYAGDMKTFLFDVNCNLPESIVRQKKEQHDLTMHNEEIKASVKKIDEADIDASKVYVVDKVVEDINTGRLGIESVLLQGFSLVDRLDFEEISELREAVLVPDKLYQVANFFNRRDHANEDARIVDTGNWGQVCSGKAIEELTREGVSLHLTMSDYERPITFEAAKKDCMNFISGRTSFMFGNKVDYTESLAKLEREEARLARAAVIKNEPRSLADIIGFAEAKKEFEKNQRGPFAMANDRDNDRFER